VPPGTFDPTGRISTVQAAGTITADGTVFAQSLGSNGRSCATCHDATLGWTVTPAAIQASFATTGGAGPLFALIDGATCPTDDLSTAAAQQAAYGLLLGKGLFRIGLPIPGTTNFAVSVLADPYGCSTNPETGLTSPTSGMISIYRRPLPATNLSFLSVIMWDGRETSLAQQAIDATLIHAQAASAPTASQQSAIVTFESAHFTAQSFDNAAQALNANGAQGGPISLAQSPTALFQAYQSWANLLGSDATTTARRSIARGEQIFNTRPFQIAGVAGVNDRPGQTSVPGNCRFCHNPAGARGNQFLNIGVTGANPPVLDVSGLPLFTVTCLATSQQVAVTDPGRALITGQCADIGKTKIPDLRGLAARAPYFHNGSAAQLINLVNFYDQRFAIGLSPQDKTDLVNYLNAL
jgi:cytochrome c peroxidase